MSEALDQLLDAWGAVQRLSPEHADRIRDSIIARPELPAMWWTDFNGRMAGAILRSNSIWTAAA